MSWAGKSSSNGSGSGRTSRQPHHDQIKRLGASVDWTRERFTMDEGLSKAVREVSCASTKRA